MKKVFISLSVLLGLSINLFSANYVETTYENIIPQNSKVMGIQPTKELIGNNLSIVKISYGWSVTQTKKTKEPLNGSRFGFYGTFSNSVQRDLSCGLDFTLSNRNFNYHGFTPYFGGGIGLGFRNDKGDRKNVSTSVNKYTYVTTKDLSTLKTPNVAIFQKDTTWIETSFSIGIEWFIKNNLSAKVGYKYQDRIYNVSYRLKGSPKILNDLTINQRYNGFEASLTYSF